MEVFKLWNIPHIARFSFYHMEGYWSLGIMIAGYMFSFCVVRVSDDD